MKKTIQTATATTLLLLTAATAHADTIGPAGNYTYPYTTPGDSVGNAGADHTALYPDPTKLPNTVGDAGR